MTRRRLRVGFSTGTTAAAAAKAAMTTLLGGVPPDRVEVSLPQGGVLTIAVEAAGRLTDSAATATVIKDAGDDPDVTDKAAITARVELLGEAGEESVEFIGGEGVGRVTRPGLPVEVGQPAINPVPREMICRSLRQAWRWGRPEAGPFQVRVEVSVTDGEKLARRTLNPRLGILGGISILGTTGLVKPFSHQAYIATIDSGLDVAKASGQGEVVLTTGGKSEKMAMALKPDLPELAFIQIADFFGHAVKAAARRGIERIGVVSFFGKAIKQAQGLAYTHAHQARLDLGRLAGWFESAGADDRLCRAVAGANTARHALTILRRAGRLELVDEVGSRMLSSVRGLAGPEPDVWAVILDFDGRPLYHGRREGER